jgi:hypothetical protein
MDKSPNIEEKANSADGKTLENRKVYEIPIILHLGCVKEMTQLTTSFDIH